MLTFLSSFSNLPNEHSQFQRVGDRRREEERQKARKMRKNTGVVYAKSNQWRRTALQITSLGMVVTSALMMWQLLICFSGSESPVVVVLTGSMEPGIRRGDILFLHMNESPIRAGEIVVFKVKGKDIPIVHRVTKVHQRQSAEVEFLTKGDNNEVDDSFGIYADGQSLLQRQDVIGRVVGNVPYIGYATITLSDYPFTKYLLLGGLSLLLFISN